DRQTDDGRGTQTNQQYTQITVTFNPDQTIPFEQAVTALKTHLTLCDNQSLPQYKGSQMAASYAVDSLEKALTIMAYNPVVFGGSKGSKGYSITPKTEINRAQVAVLLYHMKKNTCRQSVQENPRGRRNDGARDRDNSRTRRNGNKTADELRKEAEDRARRIKERVGASRR
ncbi:MAG: hypothetical protein AAGJ35_10645, partial [Myxococcota bacterium]